jgi:hypothetical protein
MNIQYKLVDPDGNDCEAEYISHFDQMKAGLDHMINGLVTTYLENEVPEIAGLAANFNSLRKTGFDDIELLSMLTVAMEQIARIRVAEKTSASNPMREGRN